jgi:hypothetical protein
VSTLVQVSGLVTFALLASCAACAEDLGHGRRVMTWVPPYAANACKERLNESFGGIAMKDGITHVGLQFWNPTEKGGIELVSRFERINDAEISEFCRWGDTNGVRVMLCVYNGTSSGWDWELATSAFDTNRTEFVDALVSETLRLKLDGVDIDFEGKGKLELSRQSFVRFIKELSGRLHAEGKELTVDTFAYKWNAPNQNWWPAILPLIDGLHVMGYSETGAGAADWRSYEFLHAAAGDHATKLLIGVPSSAAEWQEIPARKHLDWIVDDASVGLAIWDAQLKDPAWRTRATWQAITRIKTGPDQPRKERQLSHPESTDDR